jgi:hypothetical protein
MAFVYCNYKDGNTHDAATIWSSILRQLAEQCQPMPAEVERFRDKFVDKRSHPEVKELTALIKSIATNFGQTFVLIDALVRYTYVSILPRRLD